MFMIVVCIFGIHKIVFYRFETCVLCWIVVVFALIALSLAALSMSVAHTGHGGHQLFIFRWLQGAIIKIVISE